MGSSAPATTLADAFSATSEDTALIIPGREPLVVSYKKLSADILSYQKQLAKLGVTPSSAVSIALPNSYEFIVSFLAASWQRAIAAPLNSAYKQEEFEFYIDDLRSAVAIVPRGAVEANAPAVRAARKYGAAVVESYLNGAKVAFDVKEAGKLKGKGNQPLEKPRPEDTALVLHTSGRQGGRKLYVPLSHRNLTRTMYNVKNTYNLTPKDRTLLVMPLFHVHGLLAAFLAPLFSGGSAIVPRSFSASTFWSDFATHGANWYTAVPTIHQILLKTPPPKPMPAIRFIRSCSSPLSPKVFHELEKTFGAPVLEAYAMTEAAHQMTSNPLPPGKRRPGCVGIGHGVEMRILDGNGDELPYDSEGEICVKGENVTSGYLNNPEANKSSFTKGGFFRTGDQGKQDKDGYITITGRIKELINKGGEKISPIEIDNLVSQHPAVAEAVSFAVDDDMYGQDIGVAIVLKSGAKLSASDLKSWMAEKVAKFKLPKQVFFTEIMPKTATGKVQRKKVGEEMVKNAGAKAKL